MSMYLEQYDNSGDEDQSAYCRMLEIKLHYIMGMLQKAGIMLDANGKPIKIDLPDAIQQDIDEMQNSIKGNW
ncbi:hypothetical protein UFOVP257_43 [uncultured Caudovirales phage]|uniref:Uncharacterized protein n=1 Tax=uncultured Caudovirales phage TaxID=2100421 RepID=A0A6J5LER8_9CAUD|nr:hypothetical protein UFOVP257_43 [uncultured Caudovirales phage]